MNPSSAPPEEEDKPKLRKGWEDVFLNVSIEEKEKMVELTEEDYLWLNVPNEFDDTEWRW